MIPAMTDITTEKRIVLGITGGVAAYKACELVRLCVKAGIAVDVVMTNAGEHFVTAVTFQALSGRPVYTDLWDASIPNNMAHIELTRDAAGVVVVPTTADFMAKLVHGRADDLLSTLIVARQPSCPLMLAPAMNVEMWQNPATQRNAQQLRADGVTLLGPGKGDQACGETGDGRMLEPEEIFASIETLFVPKILSGKHVLITAGPTQEPIDPVRMITNHSSGKMGYAIAEAARAAGAKVTLVSGPVGLATPFGVVRIDVATAQQMFEAVTAWAAQADVFIAVAAVADYHVVNRSEQKMKKDGSGRMTLELAENPDILAHVAGLPQPPFCVGFAAESEKLLEHANAKRRRKPVPLLVANLAQAAFGADENEIVLLDDAGNHPLPRAPKGLLARQIVAAIARSLAGSSPRNT
jgi:phosphopantothenoylcysteine decarboxylase / phosphopantothenate---cysteine ligase